MQRHKHRIRHFLLVKTRQLSSLCLTESKNKRGHYQDFMLHNKLLSKCQDKLCKSKVLITGSIFTEALRWQLAFWKFPTIKAAFLSAHLREPIWIILCNCGQTLLLKVHKKFPHQKSKVWPTFPRLIERSAHSSRFHPLERDEFSAFQTNAAATFLAGSSGIPPVLYFRL